MGTSSTGASSWPSSSGQWKRRAEKAEATVERLRVAAAYAWTIIANVSGGDWSKQSLEWYEAACKWRDEFYHLTDAPDQEEGE